MAHFLNNVFRKSVFMGVTVLMLTVTIFLGCGGKDGTTEKSSETSSEKENFIPNPHMQGEQKKKILLEDVADPKSYDIPRIQFTSKYPKSDWNSLWSIKVDGTDLRKVMTIEEIHGEKGELILDPRRSPNNRYVAFDTIAGADNEKILFDLKERKRYVMIKGSCKASINWVPDGSEVWFDACTSEKAALFAYNVEKHTLREVDKSKKAKVRYKGWVINPKTKKIYMYGLDERDLDIVGVFTLDWKKIKIIHFRHFRTIFEISPDGTKLISGEYKFPFLIYDFDKNKVLYKQKRNFFSPIFSMDSKTIYAAGAHSIECVDSTNGKILRYIKLPFEMNPNNISLHNF